ncbi:MAG: glycosyltransferase family 1 protein [Caldilineaceae bacterium]
MSIHVALNAQLLHTDAGYRSAGVSNYSSHLLQALGALAQCGCDQQWRFTAYLNAKDFAAAGLALQQSHLPLQQPLLRIGWEQTLFPFLLRRHQAQLVHGMVNVIPLASTIPAVVTVHDLSFVRFPEKFPWAKRFYLTQLCRASVHKARHVIAVSQQTAHDLQSFFGVNDQKISVIYNGVDQRFTPASTAHGDAFRRRRQLPARYLLYLGTLEPRKNLPLLLEAYAQWRAQTTPANRDVQLVLAGGKGWYYADIFRWVTELKLTDVVHFPGFIPPAELPDWYRAAEAFVYPSLFEGFGLPVLEAMACGTPVICSDASSLTEIVADSALTFAARQREALVNAFHHFFRHADLQERLRNQGLQRAQDFSWTKAAAATLKIYETVMGLQP